VSGVSAKGVHTVKVWVRIIHKCILYEILQWFISKVACQSVTVLLGHSNYVVPFIQVHSFFS